MFLNNHQWACRSFMASWCPRLGIEQVMFFHDGVNLTFRVLSCFCFCFWFALMLICFILGHTRCLQLIRYLPVCVTLFWGVVFIIIVAAVVITVVGINVYIFADVHVWGNAADFFLDFFLFSFLRIATKNKLKLCSEKQSWAQIRLLRNKRRKNRGGGICFRWGMSWTRSELVRRQVIWWM